MNVHLTPKYSATYIYTYVCIYYTYKHTCIVTKSMCAYICEYVYKCTTHAVRESVQMGRNVSNCKIQVNGMGAY